MALAHVRAGQPRLARSTAPRCSLAALRRPVPHAGWGYSPLQAGLAVSPGAIVAAVVALRAGPLVAARGPRPVVVAGLLDHRGDRGLGRWLAIGDDPAFLTLWLPASLPLGIGMGRDRDRRCRRPPRWRSGPREFAAGIGLNQAARAVGGALGVAAMATILAGTDPTAAASYGGVYRVVHHLARRGGRRRVRAEREGSGAMIRDIDVLAREWADPHVAADHELARMMRPPVRWERVVVLGDSVAEGVREPSPGYRDLSWADRLRAAFALARPGATLFNLGRRDLLGGRDPGRAARARAGAAPRPGDRDRGRQRRAAAALRRRALVAAELRALITPLRDGGRRRPDVRPVST